MLIKNNDITTLRRYVKMSFTASAVQSMPDLDAAERKFLIPILTQPVYDALQLQVDNNAITWTSLLNICRAAAAPLAVWLDLPFYQASIEDGGVKTTSSEYKQAAHQWEYREIEKALVNKGMAALEDLINHLIANAATYSWTNAEATESFIRTGTEFNKIIFLNQPNLTFQQLKPLMVEVEDHFIRGSIGDDLFEYLRDVTDPTPEEKTAITLIKKAIANYTVVRAVERLPVKITPAGLMASLQNGTEGNVDKPAADNQLIY
jgi:hypothetical protein